jgi:hypothetical protein
MAMSNGLKNAGALRERTRLMRAALDELARWRAAQRTTNKKLIAERTAALVRAQDRIERGPGGKCHRELLPEREWEGKERG